MKTAYQLAYEAAYNELSVLREVCEKKAMVDSKAKGQRAEYDVRNILREATGHSWERVPGSGGFNKSHGLKGDIYLPNESSKYCIEVKHYKDDVITSNLLNESESQLEKFWKQTVREASEINKEPLLIFKKDRGKWRVATRKTCDTQYCLVFYTGFDMFYIYDFQKWLAQHKGDLVK